MAELFEEEMRESLRALYWLLRFGAVWPCDSSDRFVHMGHRIYAVIATCFYAFITSTEAVFMTQTLDDMQKCTDAATTLFTTMTTLTKLFYLFWKRDYLTRLFRSFLFTDYGVTMPFIKEVHTSPALWDREKTGEFKKYLDDSLKKSLKECRFLFKTLGNALTITVLEYLVNPVFLTIIDYYVTGTKEKRWHLPFRMAVPWRYDQPVGYALTYFMHIVAAAVTLQGYLGMDLFFGCIMVMINRQYTVLGEVIRGLDGFAHERKMDNGQSYVDREEQTVDEFQASDDACYRLLVECVKHYDRLLMECNLINSELGMVFLVQFVTSSITLCLVTYKASTEENIGDICIYLVYFFAANFQLLVYCYYGEKMLELGTQLGDLAYQMPWLDRSIKFQNGVRMLIRQSQRQMRLTAAGFSDVSLPTFTSIASTAMSYYTLLRSMNE